MLLLLFVQKITYLDLCHTPIYEQFYTGNITAIIRSKERDGFRDFVRTSHSSQRHGGYNARHELLVRATGHRCVNRTRTYGVDSDLALFQLDCPGASERPYGGFGCAVNGCRWESFGCSDRSIQNDGTPSSVLK
jgi:hypothetical protein